MYFKYIYWFFASLWTSDDIREVGRWSWIVRKWGFGRSWSWQSGQLKENHKQIVLKLQTMKCFLSSNNFSWRPLIQEIFFFFLLRGLLLLLQDEKLQSGHRVTSKFSCWLIATTAELFQDIKLTFCTDTDNKSRLNLKMWLVTILVIKHYWHGNGA